MTTHISSRVPFFYLISLNKYFVAKLLLFPNLALVLNSALASFLVCYLKVSQFVWHIGNFTSSIYAENCIFEDPTIKFSGKNHSFAIINLINHY